MPTPPFRLQSLLTFREHQRDLCRQQLARVLAVDTELAQQRDETLQRRQALLEEMALLQAQTRMDVDQTAKRRYYAGQLQRDAQRLDLQREQLIPQLTACRQALIQADQAVKALELLAEKQVREWGILQEQRESREREEAWQAGQLSKHR